MLICHGGTTPLKEIHGYPDLIAGRERVPISVITSRAQNLGLSLLSPFVLWYNKPLRKWITCAYFQMKGREVMQSLESATGDQDHVVQCIHWQTALPYWKEDEIRISWDVGWKSMTLLATTCSSPRLCCPRACSSAGTASTACYGRLEVTQSTSMGQYGSAPAP